MPLSTYREKLIHPISKKEAVGVRVIDDPLLDFIENQSIKIGSLSHDEVKWDELESSTVTLLSEKTKDLKLLAILLLCLQNRATLETFLLSLQLLADFMSHYWESCHPVPGKRGVLPRRKFFEQIIQRSQKAVGRVNFDLLETEAEKSLTDSVSELEKFAQNLQLPLDELNHLKKLIERKIKGEGQKTAPQENSDRPKAEKTSLSSNQKTSPSNLTIDSADSRSLKLSLCKIADFLAEFAEGQAIGLRLRRFALWHEISSLPDFNAEGETELIAVTVDRVQEYEDRLAKGADLALWRQVEKSLMGCIYWLDGHYLSYRIAKALKLEEAALAITEQTLSFINRLPGLLNCRFKGGRPFASDATQSWLKGCHSNNSSSGSAQSSDWQKTRQEAEVLVKEGGFAVAIAMLDEGQNQAQELRDSFYWRLLTADVMQDNGFEAIAKQQYSSLNSQLQNLSVLEWEPSLVNRLKKLTDSTTLVG